MRVETASKNIKYAIATYGFTNFLKFVVRIVFIKSLPIEYLGINGLFSNIVTMLSVAELGVHASVTAALYRPLAESDEDKIIAIMRLFKKAYIFIGFFILLSGCCLIPLLPWFIKGHTGIENLIGIYICFILNAFISYLFSYNRSLLIADQKRYISNIYTNIFKVLLSVMQIIALLLTKSFWLYIALMTVMTFVENYCVYHKVLQMYPFLKNGKSIDLAPYIKKSIVQNIKGLSLHKLNTAIITSVSNIILSKFVGLVAVGIYSNYLMVITAMDTFAKQIFMGLTPTVGNMILDSDIGKKNKIFRIIDFFTAWQAYIVIVGLYVFFDVFIELWIGKKFVLEPTAISAIVINFYLIYRGYSVITFRDAAGLYWQDRYKSILEVVINLIFSVFLTIKYGLVGVIYGGIIGTALTGFWMEPYVLFRNSIDIKLKDYFKDYFKYAAVTLLTAVFSKWLYSKFFNEVTIANFVLGVVVCLVVTNAVWIVIFSKREEMAYLRNVARDKFGMKFL